MLVAEFLEVTLDRIKTRRKSGLLFSHRGDLVKRREDARETRGVHLGLIDGTPILSVRALIR
jgi:hypothetical protein